MVAFPEVSVGAGTHYGQLTVFPLFLQETPAIDYLLSDEGIGSGQVVVEEISEQGSVPELLVDNESDSLVLFLEGEELVGAKQKRILNTSVLVGANTKVKIPVSCVEQGRWRHKGKTFGSSGSHSSSKLRRALKASVSSSLTNHFGHRSDQGEVWREVERQQSALNAASETAAMSDTFIAHEAPVQEYRQNLTYPTGACGFAAAVGGKLVAIDVFDKPATCEKVWSRLLSGYILDALEVVDAAEDVDENDVIGLLQSAQTFAWEKVAAVSEGEEHRAKSENDLHASTLMYNGALLHGSLVV